LIGLPVANLRLSGDANRRLYFCVSVTHLTDAPPADAIELLVMLNEKQFRERASRELREIGKQALALATDRDLYGRFEREVVQPNPELAGNGTAFLEMLRGAYTDATTMRLRRLLAPEANLSLRRIVVQLADYPDLLHQKITARELADDAAELGKLAAHLKEQIEPHFSPRERTPGALGSTNRELDRAMDRFCDLVKKYYWVVAGGYLDFEVKYTGDPLAVFRSAWMR
jgi:hypothetical protein